MEARAPGELCPGARNEPNIPLARQTQSEERFNSIKTWILIILSESTLDLGWIRTRFTLHFLHLSAPELEIAFAPIGKRI